VIQGDPDAGRPGLSSAVDVVVSAHTHRAYNCLIGGMIVTSAASYGRIVTKIDLAIDPVTRRVVEKHAHNIAVTRDVPPDAEVARIVADYESKAAPMTSRVVGYVKADFVGNPTVVGVSSCETPLGDLVADAQLAATKDAAHGKADVAFMNDGGIRADLVTRRPNKADFVVTYAEAFDVQPFGHDLVTMTLSGAQIRALLLGQFGRDRPRVLQVSEGFGYAYTYDRATKKATIDPKSIRVGGAQLDPARTYRVTVNSFLAGGGDGFALLKEGTERVTGPADLDALITYLSRKSTANAPLDPSRARGRIAGDACH
jgi:5'-nucleotidase